MDRSKRRDSFEHLLREAVEEHMGEARPRPSVWRNVHLELRRPAEPWTHLGLTLALILSCLPDGRFRC